MHAIPLDAKVMIVDPKTIEIKKLFPTPLAVIRLPEAEALNAELRAIILRRMEADHQGAKFSNNGGWQSAHDFMSWEEAACGTLIQAAKEFVFQLTAVQDPQKGLLEPHFEWNINAWANVNQAGDSNGLHGHSGAFWSGVYWVDDGGRHEDAGAAGDLEFSDPRGMIASVYNPHLRMKIEGCLTDGFDTYPARAGTFIMFPSWLMHSVNVFKGNRPRISIAFNFGV